MTNVTAYPWGKIDKQGRTHHLEHHCADVAACFEALVEEPVLRNRFNHAIGGDGLDDVTLARLSVLAFLHDFGKVCAGFQFKRRGGRSGAPSPAGHIDAAIWAFKRLDIVTSTGLNELYKWGNTGLQQFLFAVLAHHGRPITGRKLIGDGKADCWYPFEGYDPVRAGRVLFERARQWFPVAFADGPALSTEFTVAHLFAGLLTIADQIGSNEELFPFEPQPDADYIHRARQRATRAVQRLGFSRSVWVRETPSTEFQALFKFESPRQLQTVVAEASLEYPLLILESETGSGKTEAAIWRFAKLWKAGLVDSLYFALPTRAAAVQLHGRVNRALRRFIPEGANLGTVLAIPGYLKVGEVTGLHVGDWQVAWRDDPGDAERLARWSAESARKFLAATAAVGTVDQVLLSGLRVKWAHLRGSALSRSLLVVDEVHASDAYMTEVLREVLRGHLALGGHALLMSATLGDEARTTLLCAETRRHQTRKSKIDEAKSISYPVLALSDFRGPSRFHFQPIDPVGYNKAVSMTQAPILREPGLIAKQAVNSARQGAKVLVVRNTVKGAQAVFEEIRGSEGEDLLIRVAGGPVVHHSRFAAEDRKLLDDAVEKALGKDHRKVGGCIVIGTQTLEQSLDIDADLLMTDLCPVDVLLQRIGRLHRHASCLRPERFSRPNCVVLVPEGSLDSEGLLEHGLGMSKTGGIYLDLRVLELTRRLVEDHPVWEIPAMNRMLVEEGTHHDRLEDIEQAKVLVVDRSQELDGRMAAQRNVARIHVLNRQKPFNAIEFPAAELNIRTRLGDDGPRIQVPSVTGPFRSEVTTFSLPAHLFRGRDGLPSKEEIEQASAESVPDGLVLTVGAHRFKYDRSGIRRRD